ncbi:hypothetical protein PTSG_01683 [Salpingoeca rosetta]|uniref:Nonsense-mediated mRNA decay factor SMG8 n=1 Tax=Salpingoeca rosetta (strain ATCC 50818 / BSB-021) TaxID=946362 RepID=F2TYN0_SALR5|nr:uncharacterized protein PTSG_01683 [Salpingoeca rosetta]EGD78704.1 hypothetical protein PTSG_01683 [Salpingoeca rosetta]|eukprot:XP_004997661.1 hypothetical protein PTSG_01683 [Salpingoeca rosetta]
MGCFQLPLTAEGLRAVVGDEDDAVQVVSFVGHSRDGHSCTAALINTIINNDIMLPSTTSPVVQSGTSSGALDACSTPTTNVEAFYDKTNRTIFLSLSAAQDPAALLALADTLLSAPQEEHARLLQDKDSHYLRAMLFLFLVSTTVVMVNASHGLDPSSLQLLRALEALKKALMDQHDGDAFLHSGRLPSLLVLAQPSLTVRHTPANLNGFHKMHEKQALELLRLSSLRSVGDPAATHPAFERLFRRPGPNFLFIQPRDAPRLAANASRVLDPVVSLLDRFSLPLHTITGSAFTLQGAGPHMRDDDGAADDDDDDDDDDDALEESVPQLGANLLGRLLQGVQTIADTDLAAAFTAQAVDAGGLDARGGSTGLYASATSFLSEANRLCGLLLARGVHHDACGAANATSDGGVKGDGHHHAQPSSTLTTGPQLAADSTPVASRANAISNVLSTHSVEACERALPQALNQYHINLPPVYSRHVHREHLAKAIAVFAVLAQGPHVHRFLSLLSQQCDEVWTAGRRQCERLSMTHHPCVHAVHRTPADARQLVDLGSVAVREHDSGVRLRCACVCGRSQSDIPDAFHISEINRFAVEAACCRACISAVLPLETRDAKQHKPAPSLSSSSSSSLSRPPRQVHAADAAAVDIGDASTMPFGTPDQGIAAMDDAPKPPACFCVYRIGDGASYVPRSGLAEQQGFLPGCQHLLPYAIYSRKGRQQQQQQQQQPSSLTRRQRHRDRTCVAKLYIGYEYESPSGKRFIAHGPDACVRVSSTGNAKGSARKSLDSAMPILMPVPKSPHELAQLVRVHIAIPDIPASVRVHPVVQVKRNMAIAITTDSVLLHPDGQYVLQFPRVFTWHERPVLLPSTTEARKHFVLLSNSITVDYHEPGS